MITEKTTRKRKTCPICKKKVYIDTMLNMEATIHGKQLKLPLICSKHYNHNKI